MTIMTSDDMRARLRPGDRLLALDVGSKTIGLATHVWGQEVVMPLQTLARVKFTHDATALAAQMTDLSVRALVIGWPLLLDGSPGKRCQSVKDFTDELERFFITSKGMTDVMMTFQDERFSTAHGDDMVDDIGKTAGKSIRHRRDAIIDSLAAQRILSEFVGV